MPEDTDTQPITRNISRRQFLRVTGFVAAAPIVGELDRIALPKKNNLGSDREASEERLSAELPAEYDFFVGIVTGDTEKTSKGMGNVVGILSGGIGNCSGLNSSKGEKSITYARYQSNGITPRPDGLIRPGEWQNVSQGLPDTTYEEESYLQIIKDPDNPLVRGLEEAGVRPLDLGGVLLYDSVRAETVKTALDTMTEEDRERTFMGPGIEALGAVLMGSENVQISDDPVMMELVQNAVGPHADRLGDLNAFTCARVSNLRFNTSSRDSFAASVTLVSANGREITISVDYALTVISTNDPSRRRGSTEPQIVSYNALGGENSDASSEQPEDDFDKARASVMTLALLLSKQEPVGATRQVV